MREVLQEVKNELARNDFASAFDTVYEIAAEEDDFNLVSDFIDVLIQCEVDVLSEFEKLGSVPGNAFYNGFAPREYIQFGNDVVQDRVLTFPDSIKTLDIEAFESAVMPRVADVRGIYVGRFALGFNRITAIIIDENTQLEEDSLSQCTELTTVYAPEGFLDEQKIKNDMVTANPFCKEEEIEIVRY